MEDIDEEVLRLVNNEARWLSELGLISDFS
jgi:hypothetical protein